MQHEDKPHLFQQHHVIKLTDCGVCHGTQISCLLKSHFITFSSTPRTNQVDYCLDLGARAKAAKVQPKNV